MSTMQRAHDLARQAKAIFTKADLEERELSPEERGQVEELLARSQKAREEADPG